MNFTGFSVAGCQKRLTTSKVTTHGHGLCQMSSAVVKVLENLLLINKLAIINFSIFIIVVLINIEPNL